MQVHVGSRRSELPQHAEKVKGAIGSPLVRSSVDVAGLIDDDLSARALAIQAARSVSVGNRTAEVMQVPVLPGRGDLPEHAVTISPAGRGRSVNISGAVERPPSVRILSIEPAGTVGIGHRAPEIVHVYGCSSRS